MANWTNSYYFESKFWIHNYSILSDIWAFCYTNLFKFLLALNPIDKRSKCDLSDSTPYLWNLFYAITFALFRSLQYRYLFLSFQANRKRLVQKSFKLLPLRVFVIFTDEKVYKEQLVSLSSVNVSPWVFYTFDIKTNLYKRSGRDVSYVGRSSIPNFVQIVSCRRFFLFQEEGCCSITV